MNITIPSYDSLLPDRNKIKAINALYSAFKKLISGGISKENLAEDVQEAIDKAENAVSTPEGAGSPGQVLQLDSEGVPSWATPSAGTVPDAELSESSTNAVQNKVITKEFNDNYAKKDGFYESMGVGTAVNLAGQVERTNDSLYRTSGGTEDIATGTARIEAFKGQTIAWNQALKDGNFAQGDLTYWMILRATATISNNIITVTKSENSRSGYIYKALDGSADKSYAIIVGHKYLMCGFVNSESPKIRIGAGSNNIDIEGTGTWFNFKYILKPKSASGTSFVFVDNSNDGIYTTQWKELQVFDLTLIYGAGNEPSTPEQFEADYQRWFGKPLTYEPYDKGSLRNVQMEGIKSVGFNQWDEEWEAGEYSIVSGNKLNDGISVRSKNKIRVIPDTIYYFQCNSRTSGNIGICWYDFSGNFIRGVATASSSFTSPANAAYLTFFAPKSWYGSVYNHDICINLSWSGVKNGTYEPYEENTISIPTTTMTGKLNGEGESVVIFPDGMKGVNDVHDEIYYVGGKTYAVKRIGRVDLGSLNWADFSGVTSAFQANVIEKAFGLSNILCGIYVNTTDTVANMPDKCIKGNNSGVPIYVKDTNYSNATTFKTAMQGVYLDYELAEPLVYEVDDFTLPARYKVNDWGTEEQLQASGANGIAAIISCLYGVNAVDILRNLPKNYISTESMDNFLAALGAAMGGTWTKTWNDTTGEYDFSFVANSQPDNSLQSTNEGE